MFVLMVNPNRMRPPIAPIGLDLLGDALDRHGIPFAICDLALADDPAASLRTALQQCEPSMIGVTIRNTDDCTLGSGGFQLDEIRGLIAALRGLSRAPIVVGGVGYSSAPREILAYTRADYGVAGDGEDLLPRLARLLGNRRSIRGLPGLVWRDGHRVRAQPAAPARIAGYPAPTRRHIDNGAFFRRGGQIGFETKRGCPMSCTYCLDPVSRGGELRLRHPGTVADELEHLLDQGVTHFHTCDPEFNIPPDHGEAVARGIRARGLQDRVRWYAYCAPAPFPESLVRAMADSGCAGIDFGADHVDAKILRTFGRGHTADDIRRAAELCRGHGIPFMLDLLLGGPGETPETLARAVDFVREVRAPCAGAALGVRVYDGTPLEARLRGDGPLASNPGVIGPVEGNPGLLHPVFYLSPELGDDPRAVLERLIGGDPRFFRGGPSEAGTDYNYNNNAALEAAIADGDRGAYWDILRRRCGSMES